MIFIWDLEIGRARSVLDGILYDLRLDLGDGLGYRIGIERQESK